MNKQLHLKLFSWFKERQADINYPDIYLYFFLTPTIGYLMVMLGYNGTWALWDPDPAVRRSIWHSIACTGLILLIIGINTRLLDVLFPWEKSPMTRLGGQYLLCVLLPTLVVIGWQYEFFQKMNTPERMEKYMHDNFPAVRSLLSLWSVFYMAWYWFARSSKRLNSKAGKGMADSLRLLPATITPEKAGKLTRRTYDQFDIAHMQEIYGFIHAEGKKTFAYDTNGARKELYAPVTFFAKRFNHRFYQIRIGVLVREDAIEKVIEKERHFLVILKGAYSIYGIGGMVQLETIKDKKAAFRKWWKGPILKEE